MRATFLNPIRDERGVALPLALIGLVSVSLLVTTALVTSSTELAISDAHQDATAALYAAEGGLQAYVAERGTVLQNQAGQAPINYTSPDGGRPVAISVVHLASQLLPTGDSMRLFTVFANPTSGGGRTLTATVTQIAPPPVPLNLNITSAMSVGGDLSVTGNAFNVTGQSLACGSLGVEALRLSSDSDLDFGSAAQYDTRVQKFSGTTDAGVNTTGEAVIERSGTREELVNSLLDSRSIDDIANSVPKTKWRYRLKTPTYTPAWLLTALALPGGVAVVDAEGGSVSINPGTYTGILIVLNGDVDIPGDVTFNGIIIAERNFSLAGSVSINGAIASLAMDGENVVNNMGDDSGLMGSVEVAYDKCKVDAALEAFANGSIPPFPLVQRTVAWLEVIR